MVHEVVAPAAEPWNAGAGCGAAGMTNLTPYTMVQRGAGGVFYPRPYMEVQRAGAAGAFDL